MCRDVNVHLGVHGAAVSFDVLQVGVLGVLGPELAYPESKLEESSWALEACKIERHGYTPLKGGSVRTGGCARIAP